MSHGNIRSSDFNAVENQRAVSHNKPSQLAGPRTAVALLVVAVLPIRPRIAAGAPKSDGLLVIGFLTVLV